LPSRLDVSCPAPTASCRGRGRLASRRSSGRGSPFVDTEAQSHSELLQDDGAVEAGAPVNVPRKDLTFDWPYDFKVIAGRRSMHLSIAFATLGIAASLALSIVALSRVETKPATTSRGPALRGVYRDGPADEPNYYVSVVDLGRGNVSGSMNFEYQDGQTSVVFTFHGVEQPLGDSSARGVLTLTPGLIPQVGSASQKPSSVPSAISASYSSATISFGECPDYLHFANTLADCDFVRTKGNQL
jgi:hypothetical protein